MPTTPTIPPSLDPDDRVAVDLDGVLTEHPRPLAAAASARFGLDLPERAFVDSAGLNVPDAVRDWVYGADGPAAALRPAPGAVAFLDDLVARVGRRNVIVITARPAASAGPTVDWLARHGFPSVEVFFADDKPRVALAQGCVVAVEDSARHARAYAAAGLTCYLLAAGDGQLPPLGPPSANGGSPGAAPGTGRILPVADLAAVSRSLAAPGDGMPERDDARPRPDRVTAPALRALPARARIVVSDAIHPAARARLAAAADLLDVDGTDRAAFLAALPEADALVVRSETQVDREAIAAGTRLQVVARAGVGVDNVDLVAATEAGVLVLNTPGANAVSAGEHTVALLLAITRQLPRADAATHAGRWERKQLTPIDLRGRTVGIVGLGRVGSVVARRLRAFEMEVVAHDPYVSPTRFSEIGARSVSYETLLESADVVTFHVPATAETTRMLDAAAIRRLKPGAIVLNVARGEVVDQDALAEAIRGGRIAGAGVDVFPHEPTTEGPLHGLPNVVLTPHIGGSSAEALAAVGEVISVTTLAALRGEAVPNAVNLPAASLDAPALRRLTTVAGAAGHLLAVLDPDLPQAVTLTVDGQVPQDVAEHVLGAALSEALQRWVERRVTPVNARLVGDEVGVAIRSVIGDPDPNCPPRFTLETAGDEPHRVTIGWDRASAEITAVDRFALERALAGHVLITHHTDQPGVIGKLGTILGRHRVNIAGMQVGRHHPGGEALMVTNVDDPIPPDALAEIAATPGVGTAYVVSLPPAEPRPAAAPDLAVAR